MSKLFYGSLKDNYGRTNGKIKSEAFSLLSEPITILKKDVAVVDNCILYPKCLFFMQDCYRYLFPNNFPKNVSSMPHFMSINIFRHKQSRDEKHIPLPNFGSMILSNRKSIP